MFHRFYFVFAALNTLNIPLRKGGARGHDTVTLVHWYIINATDIFIVSLNIPQQTQTLLKHPGGWLQTSQMVAVILMFLNQSVILKTWMGTDD